MNMGSATTNVIAQRAQRQCEAVQAQSPNGGGSITRRGWTVQPHIGIVFDDAAQENQQIGL
jgi:hypothetical protein